MLCGTFKLPVIVLSAIEEGNRASSIVPEEKKDVAESPEFATVAVPTFKLAAVPEAFVITPAEGVPKSGVTSVGEVANTSAPVPVSFVRMAASSAEVSISVTVSDPPAPVPSPSLSQAEPVHRQMVADDPAAESHAPTAESSTTITVSFVAG